MIKLKPLTVLAASFLLLWGMSCQSPSSSGNPSSPSLAGNQQTSNSPTGPSTNTPVVGTLKLTITDGPVDNVAEILVKITEIRVHQSSGDENSGFLTVWTNPGNEITDILKLKGTPIVLTLPGIPVGQYNQIRMTLSKEFQGQISFKGAPTVYYPLSVPSDELKIHLQFDVVGAAMTEITLDFDAEQSLHVVQRGKKTDYLLRPVINPVSLKTTAES
jgi:Domain of unknown function (DUF4382)